MQVAIEEKQIMQPLVKTKTTIEGKESKNTIYIYVCVCVCVCVCVKGAIVLKLPTKAQKHTRHHHKKGKNNRIK